MKTTVRFNKWILMAMVFPFTIGATAQVGGLPNAGNMTVCLSSTQPYGVVPTAGSTYTWTIIPGSGGGGAITPGAAPNNIISVTWTSSGVCVLRVVETTATCTGNPVEITVTVLPGLLPGVASADQIICYNTIPNPLSSTEPVGGDGTYTYQWESSVDGGASWVAEAGGTTLTFAPAALTVSTSYHLIQTAGASCGTVTTNSVIITVQPELVTSPIWHN